MKIAFVTTLNPNKISSWSGTTYYLFKTLKQEYEVEWINPQINKLPYKIKKFVHKIFYNKKYDFLHDINYSKKLGFKIASILKNKNYDIIFAPAASAEIAFLETNIPIYYCTDAVFAGILNYYEDYSNLSRNNIESGNYIEQCAINKCKKIIVSSNWTKNTILTKYKCGEDKIHIIPFGTNILLKKDCFEDNRNNTDEIKLLFIGVDWERKGGQIAIDTMLDLNNRGQKTKLVIVGCNLPKNINLENIEVYSKIDKSVPEELDLLISLYKQATFFILPTKAEAAGIVFSESSSFGLPIITYDTGGVSTYVINGTNGYTLPIGSNYKKYSDIIYDLYKDNYRYTSLRKSAYGYYKEHLNWNSWLSHFSTIIGDIT